jgi:WD40 repeat protein
MPAPTRFCPHCGAVNAAESTYCSACQYPLDDRPRDPPIKPPTPARTTRRQVLTTALALGGAAVGVAGIIGLCELVTRPTYHGVYGTVPAPPPSPGATRQQFVYRGHKGAITALSWSPDGTMVASGSADKTVQVWRSSDGALLYKLVGYDLPVTSVVWATNEKNVIASGGQSDGSVPVWDALRDHRYLIFHGDGRVLALAWQPNSPWIASGGTDRDIYTWNAETGAKGPNYRGHKGDVRALAWLPDGQTRDKIEGGQVASGGADSTVQIWNAANARNVFTYTGHKAGINSIAVLHQYEVNQPASAIISASDDGTVQVWSPQSTIPATVYRGHHGKVNAVASVFAVPYYGPLVASAGDDQSVQIWQRSGHRLLVYNQHRASVKALAVSPVDRRVVSGDENGLVHLWTITGLNTY